MCHYRALVQKNFPLDRERPCTEKTFPHRIAS
nr:MAG TPA: hypothetical protein [Caudoviricetes sp.]